MSLTILLLAALLAQAEVSWALKMWRCDPAFKIHDPEMALKQRRFSLTLAKAGGPLKWSTVSADGGKAHGSGKVLSLRPWTQQLQSTDEYGAPLPAQPVPCVSVVAEVPSAPDFDRFSICQMPKTIVWIPEHEDGMMKTDDVAKTALCH